MTRYLLPLSLVVAAVLVFMYARSTTNEPDRAPAANGGSNDLSSLVTDQGAGKVYQLPIQQQLTLINTVEHFCVKEYHRDSCIHHLITCGVPCLAAVPKSERTRIFEDYQKLRAERGLPPLPNVSHGLTEDE
jgi:hypothetical protein